MEEFTGIDIEKIYIIAHKREPEKFDFYNPCRKVDGFVLITSGEGYAVTPDGEKINISKDDILILRKNDNYELHFEDVCSYITSGYDLRFDDGKDFHITLPHVIKCPTNMIKKIISLCDIWQSKKWNSYSLCRIGLIEFYP